MSGFKKVKFYQYKEDGKFGITFKHKGQMYELQCTDIGKGFTFDFVPCMKRMSLYDSEDTLNIKSDHLEYVWDYDNPIFDNVISKGKIQ
jgi:hypothetical protein|tara:strand:+ start:247 stop:513 length:267 start_codon:yes stop_codon:yes gene_type:complete